MIAFVEAHSTFARLYLKASLNEAAFLALKREFTADWSAYLQVGMTQPLMQRAADLTEAFLWVLTTACTLPQPIFSSNSPANR